MPEVPETTRKPHPPPWDRIFSLGTRIFVWSLLAGLVYLLQPFFLLLFLTFVFAYIQAHGVDGLAHRISTRWVRVVLVFVVFLGTLVAVGVYLTPHFEEQITTIAASYEGWVEDADVGFKSFAKDNGFEDRLPNDFHLGQGIQELLGLGDPNEGKETIQNTLAFMTSTATWILAIGSAFLLSLLFSFLIVLDLPKLTHGVRGLASSKIGFIYEEVADSIYSFCKVLGRAMEAQAVIALCNTVLTAIGLTIIGVGEGNMVFLCTVVFFCSFIPVAGVFISSTPIGIAALTEGGIGLCLLSIAMILIIHTIEAYILNPKIYGHHLRMNAVLTLIILVICGKLFGPWGLILGIPVFNYVFKHAIRFKQPQVVEGDVLEPPRPAESA